MDFVGSVSRIGALLSPRARRRAQWIGLAYFCVAMLESLAIASLMPFLAVVGNPDLLQSSEVIGRLLDAIGPVEPMRVLVILGGASCAMFIVAAVAHAVVEARVNRFVEEQRTRLSIQLLGAALYGPYDVVFHYNTNEFIKLIIGDVDRLVHYGLRPTMTFLAHVTRVVAVLGLLLLVAPLIALLSALILGSAYALSYAVFARWVKRSGTRLSQSDGARHRLASDILRNQKSVRIAGAEPEMLARFAVPVQDYSFEVTANNNLSRLPRIVTETVAIGGTILAIVIAIVLAGGFSDTTLGRVLPTLGIFALAGLRALPALQIVYQSIWNVQMSAPSVARIAEALDSLPHRDIDTPGAAPRAAPALQFARLDVCNMSYAHPGVAHTVFDDMTFTVEAGERVAIMGPSGAGKSTLLDIVLGLRRPQRGTVLINGQPLDQIPLASWHRSIAYVSQDCLLLDGSLRDNIAINSRAGAFDPARFDASVERANLSGLLGSIPGGADALVGEGGTTLSGGERQRVLWARAIYTNAPILILDEPTSALDGATTTEIADMIDTIGRDTTILLVSHDPDFAETVCDRVLRLG